MTRRSGASRHDRALPGGATLTTLEGSQPGPVLALLGGIHGDEDEGVLAVRRLIAELPASGFRGTVRAVAPAHPAAWAAFSRCSPLDGTNLARSFPGHPGGGPTAELAAAITSEVIARADTLIDLHSAGHAYSMPLMAGYVEATTSRDTSRSVAEAFGAPLIWSHPNAEPGRSVSAAAALGVPAIYVESSGGGSIRADQLDAYLNGVRNVMSVMGMLDRDGDVPAPASRWVFGSGDLDSGAEAPRSGYFVSSTRAGEIVEAGMEIGQIYDYDGWLLNTVRCERAGMVMFLRRLARVRAGDVLYVMARLDQGDD
jgi:predicted deacylase